MRLLIVPLCGIVIFTLLFAGCMSIKPVDPMATTPDIITQIPSPMTTPGLSNLTIRASPTRYSPLMSSTVGIGLTPEYSGIGPVVYAWNTTYGYFVNWSAPDFKVTGYNDSVETTGPTIYWSYPADDMGKEKPPVTVRLIIKTPPRAHGGNCTIAWKDLHITWENNDTAVFVQER